MTLRVDLLGGLRVTTDAQGPGIFLPNRKARALLAYLALPAGRVHSRDKLAALLWGDRGASQARASLRQELYGLRRALTATEPEALRLADDSVWLDPARVDVDTARLERALGDGTAGALETALALYQGDLLQGLEIEEPAFEAWLRAERERLRSGVVQALTALFMRQREGAAFEAAVETGLRLLALEPTQESLHRDVIRLQLALGRRGAARRQYQACVAALERELGIEPEPETRRLYHEILRPALRPGQPFGIGHAEPGPLSGGGAVRAPFTGRQSELARLEQELAALRAGGGRIALVVGEPGIGKTRLLEEFAARARRAGAQVLFGRCLEGELASPFGPFAEALAGYARKRDGPSLRLDLGGFAATVAKLVPALRERFPELAAPAPLSPEEERHRLLDALAQFLWACARRSPVVILLDDLHWADGATLALLRYLARFLAEHRVLLVAAHWEHEPDPRRPLRDALGALRREARVERIGLAGLDREAVATLVSAMARRPPPEAFVRTVAAETGGNPFFLYEVLLHLLEQGRLGGTADASHWPLSIHEMGVPEGLRQVVGRRVARLSEEAHRLLVTAACCTGAFRFDAVAAAAELDEERALDALDEALDAQLLDPAGEPETYHLPHALIRHTLYGEQSPSRRLRVHRRLAQELERAYGDQAPEHPVEIAEQWHRSAALPGAQQGIGHCLLAAERAEQTADAETAAAALGMALDLLAPSDPRRPRLVARLGLALAWSGAPSKAFDVAREAGERIAASEGDAAAADYLADAAQALYGASYDAGAWALAQRGLRHVGQRRDLTWARLLALELERREAADPDFPGIPLDGPERRQVSRILLDHLPRLVEQGLAAGMSAMLFESRADALARGGALPAVQLHWAGEYARAAELSAQRAARALEGGRLALAALDLAVVTRCQSALGNLEASLESFAEARALVARLGCPPFLVLQLEAAALEHTLLRGEDYQTLLPVSDRFLSEDRPENRWAAAAIRAATALAYTLTGRSEDAKRAIGELLPAIERAAGWAANYSAILSWSIETLWILGWTEPVPILERNLREKTLAPDFRYPHTDARLALARLCALTGRCEEARTWFAAARRVLEEQGARPLRAVCDFDEAWMELRRGPAGDRARALALLDAASGPFRTIGMTGWLRRAEELRAQLA